MEHNLAWKTHLHVAEEKALVGFNTAWRLSLCPSVLLGHEKAGGCGIQMGERHTIFITWTSEETKRQNSWGVMSLFVQTQCAMFYWPQNPQG